MALKPLTNRLKTRENLKAERSRMKRIISRLSSEFKPWRHFNDNPFLLLVGTVLSQNTNDRNSFAAYTRLVSKFKTPEEIANANTLEIQKLIRTAGLYRLKSKRLKEISREILERYGGDISKVLRKPYQEARNELLSLRGIGFKTADVVLAFGAGRDVFPVDTHVFRVSKRLGFAGKKDDYEKVKNKLEMITPAGRRRIGHMLLIMLGRRYCRARNPMHKKCTINRLCPIGIRHAGRARL
jgi:endonuclease-3